MREQTVAAILHRYPQKLHDFPEYRQRERVFEDREHAGAVLAELLGDYQGVILAVPAGGVPVAVSLARRLELPVDVVSVSKITLPGNTEVGCGAVGFDGSVELNEPLLRHLGLGSRELFDRIAETRARVRRRQSMFRAERPALQLDGRNVVLVDDGLASGFTMGVAAAAVKKLEPARIAVAVPTAPVASALHLLDRVDGVWCANLRAGDGFAVADAYRRWRDVDEEEAAGLLRRAKLEDPGALA